jgi:hypothetical protein
MGLLFNCAKWTPSSGGLHPLVCTGSPRNAANVILKARLFSVNRLAPHVGHNPEILDGQDLSTTLEGVAQMPVPKAIRCASESDRIAQRGQGWVGVRCLIWALRKQIVHSPNLSRDGGMSAGLAHWVW